MDEWMDGVRFENCSKVSRHATEARLRSWFHAGPNRGNHRKARSWQSDQALTNERAHRWLASYVRALDSGNDIGVRKRMMELRLRDCCDPICALLYPFHNVRFVQGLNARVGGIEGCS